MNRRFPWRGTSAGRGAPRRRSWRPSARVGRVALATAVVGGSVVAVDLFVLPTPVADAAPLCATPPTSGTTTVSGVVNTYYPATSAIAAGTTNTSVTVGTPRGGAALAVGDLVLVIQMQGAAINATNTAAYGDGVAGGVGSGFLNNATYTAGLYEYARVSSVAGTAIGLTGAGTNDGLVNSYVNADATATQGQQRFQLVRVPQYFDATLSTGAAAPTALAWNGTSGGILAIDAANDLNLNSSSISVDGLGFRGGLQRTRAGVASGVTDSDYRTLTSATVNGQKAEGIAGSPRWQTGNADNVGDGYPNGDFGRGAPGNAGGGGSDGNPTTNDQNTGGGGGGNGGTGGTGGNAWSSNEAFGGFGGSTVAATAGRVILGGGGGAGSDNNAVGSSAGGAGGGIVLFRAGALTGTGTISANGAAGSVSGQDAGGGGGAGGSIVVLTSTTGGFGNLTARANGGAGGNTTFGGNNNADRHGPGAGGGGGRIFTSGTTNAASTAALGAGGIHTPTNQAYGATAGTAGTLTTTASLADVTGANSGSQCIDVSVTKTITTSPVVPGSPVSFSVVVTNNGPHPRGTALAAIGVTDTLPAGLTGASWTCTATAGSNCGTLASGSGNISGTVNLQRGDSATFTINATLSPSFTGTLSNTAAATPPTGIVDTNTTNNSATATATPTPVANLGITKDDGATVSTPGATTTYTVVVSNAGPSTAAGASVTDALPAGATSGTWTCTAGACGSTSGTLPMNTTVTLTPGQTATYSVTVVVPPGATGSLANTATVTAPAGTNDPTPGNNTATDTNTLTPRADLSIAKTDGVTTRVAGQANPYTITVSNAGPSTIVGATVADTFPADYTNASWTCTASAGSSCPASGSGNINALVTVAAAGTLTFNVTGTVSPTAAAGTLSNTATVTLPGGSTDPTPGNNSATDTTTITRSADLSITKTDGVTSEVPGTSVTYTIVVSNTGPSTAVAAPVADTLPATLSGATWSCSATAGSSCAAASGLGNIATNVTLAPAGQATFTLTANIASGATGTLANTATVTAPAATPDPTAGNNSATDTDTLAPEADLSITKTDGALSDVPGTSITYTIVAANTGPSTVTNATVTDTFPATITGATWTCVGAGGGTCTASGSGNLNTTVTLPPGGTATYTVTGTIVATATGTLSNTATITQPGGVTDPTPGNNSATDTSTLTPTGDLAITKTDGVTSEVPGTSVTYTIVASNTGPSAMTGVTVADAFPATITGITWTCVGAGGGTCPASGAGNINATVSLPVGGTATFTASGTISATATGSLANTATIAAAPGTTDPNGGNNSATDSDTLTPQADVAVTKTDGVTIAVPGSTLTYTITATNTGPSAAPGTTVTDTFPAGLTGVTWTCTGAGGGTCPASGSGNINTSAVNLPVGATVTFVATGTVAAGATGSLTNSVSASVGGGITDPTPGNNTATDVDTLTPTADLVITKTDGATTEIPGSTVTYTIVATNTGPSTVTGATVTDTVPTSLTGATWTCAASGGSSCATPSGSGNIGAAVTLLPSGTATFTLTATISAAATGTLSNTVSIAAPGGVTDPTPGNNSATDTDTLVPTADLSVTKTDGLTTEIPGTGAVYTVVVTNGGPSNVIGATVADTLPAILLGPTWACTASAGSSCPATGSGNINATVDLLSGGTATFTITGQISGTATGNLVNTATVTAPGTVTDPNAGNNSATDTDTLVPTADLSITKTDGVATAVPGSSITYTIVASNAGPSTVTGATVADTFPAALTGVTWTCVGAGGGTCPASGSGNLNAAVNLPSGGTATFTVTATVSPAATGTLVNTATIAVPGGVTDPTPGNNSATDTDTLTPQANLSITKTDGTTTAVPGSSVTYTIVASNAGPSAVLGATVADTFPAALTGATWTCTGAGGGTCPASGSGNVNAAVDLPVGATATFTVTATVASTATGTLVNTATVAPPAGVTDPTPGNNSATDSDTLTPRADLSITKDDGVSSATPGESTTYTVVVTNAGPSTVTAAPVSDPLPVGATSGTWTCAPAARCAATSGTMPLASSVTLATGEAATYTVTVAIASTATGSLANTATVAAPTGVVDPDSANNAATDTDTLTPRADVSISKTDGLTTVVNGQSVTYTVVVSNPGPSTVTGGTVNDSVPTALTGVAWTCAASAGSTCPAGASGSITNAAVTLAPGGTATFTITGTVAASATGTLTNTATVTLPGGVTDPTPGNNTATDTTTITPQADLRITKTDGTTTALPGGSTVYTVTANNAGPADAPNSTVTDPIPAGATAMTWTCTGAAGGTCPAAGTGAINATVGLPVGASVTFTVTVSIAASATGPFSNTATVAPPAGVTDPTPGNNSATDTDTLTPQADLSVTKTDGVTSAVPGGTITYTIVVGNAGPSNAPLTSVTDTPPAGITFTSWSCVPGVGANCAATSGSGPISTTVDLPAGTSATFTVTAAIDPAATGTLANTVTVAPAGGVTDPSPGNNSATDTDTLTPQADLAITKGNGVAAVVPGTPVTYSIVATNAGPSAVPGARITDTIPAAITGATWTCAGTAGGTCANPAGTGNIDELVTLPVGGSVTFTVTGTVAATATGSLDNTATIAPPTGVTDPVPGNDSATDSDPLTPQADLSITKTDGVTTAVPGSALTYTITATNGGPSAAPGSTVSDTFPGALGGVTWTCSGTGGATCPANGSGAINATVGLPVGGTVTFTATGTVLPGATGSLTNTATVATGAGVTDPDPADNTATDVDTLTPTADLVITKTDGATTEVPGTSVTYTVVATNTGPSTVVGATVNDTLPATLTGATWTCTPSLGSTCPATGTGSLAEAVTLLPGGTATFSITATIGANATGTLSNTATVAAPGGVTDPTPGNNTATDTDTLTPQVDLQATKSNGVTAVTPGSNTVYTVTITNAGPSLADDAGVSDPLPTGATAMSWTCTAAAGSTCPASGTGSIATTVDLAPGSSVTFTVTVTISAGASGTFTNEVTATAPLGTTELAPGDNTATDTDPLVPGGDLSITKTDGVTTAVPGSALTYTITASNAGPSNITGATVTDTLSATLTGATWTCIGTGGGTCTATGTGNIGDTVNLPVGASVTYTVTATVSPAATGTLVNTATVTTPAGTNDPNLANNTATDTDTLTPTADVSITKSDGTATAVPGSAVTYTIVATNAGPSAVVGALVSDTLPASLLNATWTCTASAGSVCPAGGSGNIGALVDLAVGGTATFVLTADIDPAATVSLANTATVGSSNATDPNVANNTATDTDTLAPSADLSITKTDGLANAQPGDTVTYTIVVSNAGPSSAPNAAVTDTVPAGLGSVSWTCAPGTGGTCDTAGGTGNAIATTADLAPGGSVTYTVTGTVVATAGSIVNDALVTAPAGVTDPNSGDNTATDVTTITPTADLSITKTDGLTTIAAGQTLTYTIEVRQTGPSAIVGAQVTDVIPALLTGVTWTCTATAGSSCESLNGSGGLDETVTLGVGGSLTFLVTGTVPAGAVAGTLTNSATVTMPVGTIDPTPANNTAQDTTTIQRVADLSVTKTDGSATAVPGTPVVYTIVAANAGPSDATGATVTDTLPASLVNPTWTCTGAGGGTCTGAGTGNIADTVNLPAGASVTYTVTATLAATATGTLANTVTVTPPAGVIDPTPGNDSATDTDTITPQADLTITKTNGVTSEVPGTTVTYSITATNAGPSAVTGATVTDTPPATITGVTWTCTPTAGATCAAAGSTQIVDTVNLAVGASVTYTLTGTIAAGATGTLANTATIAPPGGVTDPTPGNNSATDTDTLTPQVDLVVTKTDGVTSEVPGTPATYTITVTNTGPSNAPGVTVDDPVPAGLLNPSWTCTAASGGTCTASGTGAILDTVNLPVGAALTYTLNGTVDPAATGTLANTVTARVPATVTELTPADNTATDTDTLTPTADLSVTKTDGLTNARPGDAVSYTVTVRNAGPSGVIGAAVNDTIPTQLGTVTWTCAATLGSSCPANGSGNVLAELVNLAPNGTATFTITGTVVGAATGTITNTATVVAPTGVTDPAPGNNTATDTTTIDPLADLSITKTDGNTEVGGGEAITYTVVVTNSGPSRIDDAPVADTFPAALTGAAWTCVATGGSACDAANGTGNITTTVDLAAGGNATFTVNATIAAGFTGTLTNTATVTMPAPGLDPTPGNNTATDTTAVRAEADLRITKTDGVTTAVPGTPITYTIVVSNFGPSNVVGAAVGDSLPATLLGATWTCAEAGGDCSPSGTGSILDTVDLPAGTSVTYTVTGTISPSATGTLTNTARVVAPPGMVELAPGDEEATDTTALQPQADLSITKTDGVADAVPGASVTYTIVAANAGPSAVVGATVADTFPAAITSATWTCAGTLGGICAAAGSGSIADTVNLPAGASVTYTVTATIAATATGTLVNTATVTAPAGVTDPTPGNNSATDTDTLTPSADLSITKSNGTATAVPGGAVTYTIVATNAGPSATSATVSDSFPASLVGAAWTCAAAGGATCTGSGSGAINQTVSLPVGGTVTYTVSGTVASGATGSIANTATVAPVGGVVDPDTANNSATDTDTLTPQADLTVTKTDGRASARPGDPITYTVVVTNEGPSAAPGSRVTDVVPTSLVGATWTCTGAAGATCANPTGTGSIDELVGLPVGGSVTFVITATVGASALGTISNTARVDAPAGVTELDPTDNAATDTTVVTPTADLAITKTDGLATVAAGAPITYTVVVSNGGPSTITGATVNDALPATLVAPTWTCIATGGGTCTAAGAGAIADTITLPAGATATYTVTATVSPTAAAGTLSNTAAVALPGGSVDPTPGNNSATDVTTIERVADLSVTKTDGLASAVPGQSVTYTIVVSNAGPSAVVGASVADTFLAAITSASWTCVGAAGGTCAASGTGNIADTVNLPVGASVTYTVTAAVSASATGTLSNTATVAAPTGVTDPTPANNTSTDTTALTPQADLSIVKSDAGVPAVPGQSVTYTIVVSNAGPSAVVGASVADTFPAAITSASWTCAGAAGGSCAASGTGNIADTVNLPVGASVTYTVTAAVSATATGTLSNTATVTAPTGVTDPNSANDSSTEVTPLAPAADLSVTKTDGLASAVPGQSVTYTIVASNAGPSAVVGASVADTFPAAITSASWTCVGAAGGTCTASGTGNIADTVNLPVGASVTYTVTAAVSPAATGTLSNTATVTAPTGVTDPNAANDSATDTTSLDPQVNLSVTKTDGLTSARPGDTITYTIVVSNAGPSSAAGARVQDPVPTQLTGVTWTCAGTGGTCPATGSGDIDTTVSITSGGSVTFTVTGTVAAAATGTASNTVTVTAPAGTSDPDPADNTATDLTTINPRADLSITKTDGNTTDVAGTGITYTIVVANAGPSRIDDAQVADTLPAALIGGVWSCVATAGSACDAANGTGNIATTVDLANGGSATFTVTATISAAFTGTLSNTATVTMPAPGEDPTPANNSATDTTTVAAEADVSVAKDDGATSAVPGTSTTYTVVVANAGPSRADGVTVTDLLPAGATSMSWTCTAAGASTCPTPATGSGAINTTVDLGVGGTATFTVTVAIGAGATGTLVNTATAAVPTGVTDPAPGNNSATDTDTLAPQADLAVIKTDGSPTAVPGGAVTYTITVTNAGPSNVIGGTVNDTVPGALTGATWTCVGAAGGTCTANGTGNIADTVNLPAGASVVYTLSGTVAAGATGTLANTATVAVPTGVTDPVPGNNSATDTDTLSPEADLSVTKTDGATTEVPGTAVTYTITVANGGRSDVVGARVEDIVPTTLTGVTWSCVPAGLATCTAGGTGNIVDAVNLPAGTSVAYTLTATVSATATGLLSNTATVAPPAGVTDPTPGNNSATDTDTLTPSADLAITKDDGLTSARPGDVITYTVTVTNTGPSAAVGAVVRDTLPGQLGSATWTCAGAAGGLCGAAAGTGSIVETVTVPVGGSVTYTITATVTAGAGSIVNTATVEAPAGTTDPDPTDNSATDTTTISPTGDVSVVKTDGLTSITPGTATSYTITVSNSGPSDALGVTVADTLPAALTAATWTCTAGTGSTCTANGAGSITDTADIAAGSSVVYTLNATVLASASGTLSNTVTITPPPGFDDSDPTNDTATDDTALAPVVDLAVTKTDGATTAVPGQPISYTITVRNTGPSVATAARVTDTLPSGLTAATWTCNASAGSTCAASGTGSIDDTVTVGVGGTLTYTLSATVAPGATGTLANTAAATPATGTTDSDPANNSVTDTDTLTPQADLSITKTDGQASSVPGEQVTYTIVVTNGGPSNVVGATVTDTLPAALTAATWTCGAGTGGGTCNVGAGAGSISTNVDLPVGATVTITLTATVASSTTAPVANTATVAVPAGVTDPNPGNDSATDTNTMTPAADLAITKTDGVTTAVPGESVTYTVVATNAGPSDVVGATLTDPLPAAAASATWTCLAAGGATCPASGAGAVNATVGVPVGGSVTFSMVVSISPAATGLLVNTASIAVPSGTTELDPANNSATDTDTLTPRADLSITKTDGLATALPGDTLTYTIVVTNAGPSAVTAAPVNDLVPAELENALWTCTSVGGSCGTASGTGNVATTVSLPVNATATITLTADVVSTALGAVANTATVDAPASVVDPTPGNNVASDTTSVSPLADVSITKTDGRATAVAGTATSYSIVVTNPGPSVLTGVRVEDTLPAALTGATWTCTASGGATCATSGNGSIDQLVDMPAASTVTFVVDAVIDAGATGTLSNTATATLPGGAVDPTPANNTATDDTTVLGVTDLAITKTDGATTATPGTTVTYTIVATNAGPSDADDARVTDTVPAALTAAGWTCAPTGAASCPASGSGSINALVDIPVGDSVTFTLTGTVDPAATGQIVNTASIAPPAGASDPTPGDNAATDTDTLVSRADIAITKTNGTSIVIPGTTTTYMIVVSNLGGPSTIAGVAVNDPLPAGVTGATWTCAAAAGSACGAASGSGALATAATVAPGADVTYTVTMQTAVAAGVLTNVVTATVPPGVVDPDPSNNSATDVDTLQLTADLSVTKLASVTEITQGAPFSFTVVVTNNGPNPLLGVAVTDVMPANVTGARWTCLPSAGASCAAASGSGDIATTVGLGVGATATFVVNVTAAPTATGAILNTVTVAPPAGAADPDPSNNSATATVPVLIRIPPAAIALTKTTPATSFGSVGQSLVYTLTATNTGGFPLTGVTISDPNATIGTCVPAHPAALAPGEALTCTATRTVTQADLDRGSIVNTAGVTSVDPNGATLQAVSQTVTVPAAVTPTLRIVKSTTTPSYSAVGDIVTYSIEVTNTGNVTLLGVTITDTIAVVTNCPPRTLAPGASMTCTATRSVTQADLDAGRIDNIASAVAQSASGATVTEVAGVSNLVTVRRVPPPGGGITPLPGTGSDVGRVLVTASLFAGLGLALVGVSRRRRPAH